MAEIIQKQLGKRIQNLRKSKGFSQEKFAEAIGIATTSLSYIETGNGFLTSDTLEKISKILNVEPYELFLFNDIFSSLSNEDMLKYIYEKLDSIKGSPEQLKSVYMYFKGIV